MSSGRISVLHQQLLSIYIVQPELTVLRRFLFRDSCLKVWSLSVLSPHWLIIFLFTVVPMRVLSLFLFLWLADPNPVMRMVGTMAVPVNIFEVPCNLWSSCLMSTASSTFFFWVNNFFWLNDFNLVVSAISISKYCNTSVAILTLLEAVIQHLCYSNLCVQQGRDWTVVFLFLQKLLWRFRCFCTTSHFSPLLPTVP